MGYRGGGGGAPSMQVAPFTKMVKLLVISNIAIWLVGQLIVDRFFLGGSFFITYFGLIPYAVLQKFFVWQLLTYGFLHSTSPMHIAFNLLALWWVGGELENRWGSRFFMTYYLVCVAGAAVLYVICLTIYSLITGNVVMMTTPVVGSSAGVFGLMLAYGIIFGERIISFMMMFPMKAKYFVMILGALELVNLISTGPAGSDVSSLAHLGGIVTGFLFLSFYTRFRMKKSGTKSSKGGTGKLKLVVNNENKSPSRGPKYWN